MAGCTDLYVSLNFGTLSATRFLDLWRLPTLRRIAMRDGMLSIGALATFTEILQSPLVRRRLPMLVAAAREIGGPQIQNRGTLGGNVANASPAGDTLPVLAAADATVVLASADGERRVPFASFYTGYRASVMRPDGSSPPSTSRRCPAVNGSEGRHARARRSPRLSWPLSSLRRTLRCVWRWASLDGGSPPLTEAALERRVHRRGAEKILLERSRRSTTCAPPRSIVAGWRRSLLARFWDEHGSSPA
jgi:hypothetical protein